MPTKQALPTLIILISLIISTHSSTTQCCCSTINGGSQGLQTTNYTFALDYLLSYINLASSPQNFLKIGGRLPSSMTNPLWRHYYKLATHLNQYASFPIDSDLQNTFTQHCINFDQIVNDNSSISLTSQSPLQTDSSQFFMFPLFNDPTLLEPQLTPQELNDQQKRLMRRALSKYKKRNRQAGNFIWVADKYQNNTAQAVTTIQNYYCIKGYLQWFKGRLIDFPNEENNYTTIMTHLFNVELPVDYGLDSIFFTRWMAIILHSKFSSLNLLQYVCPPTATNSTCNKLC